MEAYRNLGGKSSVVNFEVGERHIDVMFKGGWIYRYTNASAGALNIQRMCNLAREGRGLATFISRVVKQAYESKRRR